MDDALAEQVLALWRAAFQDAAILPVIGYPSHAGGVCTITHTMGTGEKMAIDGLVSSSPLANNALYSAEVVAGGQWLNLYEIMLPDVPGRAGAPSSCQRYIRAAGQLGIDVAGVHFHWTGASMRGRMPLALHTQSVGLHPFEFTKRTIRAIQAAMA